MTTSLLRWENLEPKQFLNLAKGIEEALKMHAFETERNCHVDAIREMLIEEITWTMKRSTIITKLEEFLQMAQEYVVDTKKFERDIVCDIVACVLTYTETTIG